LHICTGLGTLSLYVISTDIDIRRKQDGQVVIKVTVKVTVILISSAQVTPPEMMEA
jgi:hypothetical protein